VDLSQKLERIRALNDDLRQNFIARNGMVVLSSNVGALPMSLKTDVLARVMGYEDFNPDNDPYGEHDFGNFDYQGATFFWKIDYYDLKMQYHSEDKSDREKTMRVLTVMMAEEY
jgi:hypothetical protein